MLTPTQNETLRDKTYQLLWETGMKIENERIRSAMLEAGCRQAASGRIRIPNELVEEMAACQKKTQEQDQRDQELHLLCGIDWAHHVIWRDKRESMRQALQSRLLVSAFDCGPTTYYDYAREKIVPVDTDVFVTAKKFAQATPEIGYISTWYRQDVPQATERIDSLVLALKHTDKVDGIEAIDPATIKYLKEISEIITERPGDSSYLAGSECITSPLILERRSADDIVERKTRGIHRYHVASMPTIGVSTPVTIAGSVVMEAAEILGGMVACFVLDPESDLSGRAIALVADMRNGNSTPSGPEPTLVNLAVRELFDTWWGGHLWVEVFFSPYAKRPGLQAVTENFYGLWRYSKLLGNPDIPYPGMGTLNSGGTGCFVQFMLDMEIRRSQLATKEEIPIDDEALPIEEICQIAAADGGFLTSEHTLKHCRDLWTSPLFLTENPDPTRWPGDEKAILDRCDQMWRENLNHYEPPQWPEEKTRALEQVLVRAKREFSGG
ncbi:MAG: trimethylamine methyltransferase family protein [Planctomycetes bacterium]|nr:trimethylamine methyltransferase family protein [Planctomycetota bacterium]